MSLKIDGIPQREDRPDKRREKLLSKMKSDGTDESLLPITPATYAVVGRIGGGKSSIMYSYLKNLFPKYYDEVIIFCSSSDSRHAFESLPQRRIVFLTEYDDSAFNDYLETLKHDQMERLEKNQDPLNVFIGFDDIVFQESISKSGGSPSSVERALLTCRHELNATMFICCQHSKQIKPSMRNNILYYIILPLQQNDVSKIAEEHSCHLTKDQFLKTYHDIMTSGKHQFLLVDYKAPEYRRFRHNFDTLINPLIINRDDERQKTAKE